MPNYFLYIIKSFRRRFQMHAGLIIMLSCAFVVPFMFAIILDSANYGTNLQRIDFTKGCDFRIENALESDLDFYDDITGLQMSYEDGTIYIKADQKLDANSRDEIASLLFIRTNEVGEGRLTFINPILDTSTQENFAKQWNFIIIILIGISMLVMQTVYIAHIGNFKSEIGILESIGASQKQIKKIFFAELIVCYTISVLISFSFAYVGTYILFKKFLQIDTIESMSWIIFHVEPMHILFLIVVMLLFLLFVFVFKFRSIIRNTPVMLMSSTINDDKLKHYKHTFKKFKNPVFVISKTLLQRSNNVFMLSLVIAIPIMIMSVFVLNYSIIYMNVLNQKTESDLIIKKYPDFSMTNGTYTNMGFFEKDIEYVKNMPEISEINFKTDYIEGDFVIHTRNSVNSELQYPFINIDEREFLLVKICAFSDLPKEYRETIFEYEEETKDGVYVAVNKNYAFTNFAVGDEIYLYKRDMTNGIVEHIHDDTCDIETEGNSDFDSIKLTIGTLLDMPYHTEAIQIYFSDEYFNKITDGANPSVMQITLKQDGDDISFVKKLSKYFSDSNSYEITNLSEKTRIKSRTSIGIFLLMDIVLFTIFMFMLVTLFMLLSEYTRRQEKNINMLFIIGASKKNILKIYMSQVIVIAAVCLAVSMGIGMFLSIAFFQGTGYKLIVTNFVFLSYLVAIFIILTAYILPVYVNLKKQLRKL